MKTSSKEKYVIATIKSWNIEKAEGFVSENSNKDILLITNKKDLTHRKIKNFNPRYIFFPHWSWIIPKEIYRNYECVIFHMTDLPFGRGGSPLQNLIARGVYKTKLSAIRAVEEVDAGPVYLKRNLNLKGSATQIFRRASRIIFEDMIPYIMKNKPVPIAQKGKVVRFKRRVPEQSDIANLKDIREIYDYIRMLDGEGYPLAFLETPNLRIEFSNAKIKEQYLLTQAKISIKEKK